MIKTIWGNAYDLSRQFTFVIVVYEEIWEIVHAKKGMCRLMFVTGCHSPTWHFRQLPNFITIFIINPTTHTQWSLNTIAINKIANNYHYVANTIFFVV